MKRLLLITLFMTLAFNIISQETKNDTINIPIIPAFIKDDKYVTDDKVTKLKFRSFDPI